MTETVTAETLLLTYEDYRQLPDDGKRYELIEGEMHMIAAPTTEHQRISFNLTVAIGTHVREQSLGSLFVAPADVVLSRWDVVQPDILFVSKDREMVITDTHVDGPPDLVIEILSPSTVSLDQLVKRQLYARHGVCEFWLVSPEAGTIEVLELHEGAYRRRALVGRGDTITSRILEGLELAIDEIFA
ncbi:MAG: Uma2 family endonuclease [Anaerolineales bacterium]|nr:MAG: Uma2 family endonuclease [Anaerolineales bacterium]